MKNGRKVVHHHEFYDSVSSTQPNASEIEFRNAMSRIYYYIYHEILSLIKENEELNTIYEEFEKKLDRDKPSSHKLLQNVFFTYATRFKNLQYTDIGKKLGSLHQLRCYADYCLDEQIKFANFNSMLYEVQDLQQKIQRLYKDTFKIELKFPDKIMVVKKIDNKEKTSNKHLRFVD